MKRLLPDQGFGAAKSGFSSSGVSSDELVKNSGADTTAGYLTSKIVGGTGITLATLNPGANEQLQINSTTTQKKRYTLNFGYGGSLGVNAFIRSVAGAASFPTVTNGYYIPVNATIIDWGINVSRFVSFDAISYTRFQLKTIVANGLRTSDITIASGINLVNYDLVYPNSSGSFQYYMGGGQSNVSYNLNAGEMLFICICAQTVNSATGVSIWVLVEED